MHCVYTLNAGYVQTLHVCMCVVCVTSPWIHIFNKYRTIFERIGEVTTYHNDKSHKSYIGHRNMTKQYWTIMLFLDCSLD